MGDGMAHWRWIACLRVPTLDDSEILTGVRPPPRDRGRSTITTIVYESGCDWWMRWSIGGCESIIQERERERRVKSANKRMECAPINCFSDGVWATCAAVPRACGNICQMEGVSDGDSVVRMVATTRHGRTDTIVVSAPRSRSNRTTDS